MEGGRWREGDGGRQMEGDGGTLGKSTWREITDHHPGARSCAGDGERLKGHRRSAFLGAVLGACAHGMRRERKTARSVGRE